VGHHPKAGPAAHRFARGPGRRGRSRRPGTGCPGGGREVSVMRAHQRTVRPTARVEYTLPRTAVSAGRARKLTTAFLTRPRPRLASPTADQVGDATLIASELVANAVRHGRSGCRPRPQLGQGR